MNIEFNNETEYDVEYVDDNLHSDAPKYKKYQILIFLGCLFLAFIVWCYANYLNNPIIQSEVPLIITLVDGENGETITQSTNYIVIYGEESVVSKITQIKNTVSVNQFSNGNKTIKIDIDFPNDIKSHQKEVEVTLIGK